MDNQGGRDLQNGVIHSPRVPAREHGGGGFNVEAMQPLELLAAIHSRGTDLLSAAYGHTAHQLAARCGMPVGEARSLVKLAATFLGETTSPRKQTDAFAAAAANGHGLATLKMIDAHARRLDDPTQQWPLRLELASMSGTFEEIRAHARRRLEELNTPAEPSQAVDPELSIRHDHARRRTTFTFTAGTRYAADLIRSLEARLPGQGDRRLELGTAFAEQLAGDEPIERTRYTPMVIIGANDLTPLMKGTGDDILLASDDGTLITGKELLDDRLTPHGFAGIFHPVTGGLNLYHTRRFASEAQRIMARAENPVCPKTGCGTPSLRGQYHHLVPVSRGGETNMSNLCACCEWDNAANDDDPGMHRHGRLVRHDGHVKWQPPGNGPPILNDHPVSRRGAMHLIRS